MRIWVAVLVVLVFAGAAHAAAPPGFTEAKQLERAASYVAGKPATVYCAGTMDAWRAYLTDTYGSASGANGSSAIGGGDEYLSANACTNLLHLKKQPFYAGLAPSMLALTHEAIHLRGERDEGVTDCAAVHEMPRVAVRFFRVKAGKQLRALMAAVWAYRGHQPAVYRSVC